MTPRVPFRSSRTSLLRARATVLAVGLGASVVLGAGGAVAADATSATTASSAAGAASAVQAQAAAQAKAAAAKKTAAKKADAVKKAKAARKARATRAGAARKASWVDPVKQYTLSASFAQSGGMWQSTHSGQDFAVSSGTRVVAAHGGTVAKAGSNGAGDGPAYGNAVVIKHGNGTYSQYAHLSRVDVKVGQIVRTGQRIALSGNTGNSSGPHLHFEIRTSANYGSAIDPVAFLRGKGVTL
ncbi:peptidase (secreted protein) [Streptomyces lincolnensis]|uniref:Peptidase (Secreted protein) n=1 Tax=Streptomyces lincolnensis TaxID=1915 RepID=A0A1B1MET3_STRLN|nr:M23 family metallopeptidase [Streptomyces lincolnensis]ANS67017.1 peptidase (secreted protein) [Streptomyces lincolnensis]AXG55889.1 peptidase (secreted protein) [Streptomyces lincolnensis]QMV07634.1 peptidoglycan DD-metalloendopeptidase family protein [Streptomyces lincolnensis]